MIDLGAVGSVTDVATLIVSLSVLARLMASQGDGHAVAAALARRVDGVDEDRVAADLEADGPRVEQYLITDGGDKEDRDA